MTDPIDLIIPGLCGPLPEHSEFHNSRVLSHFISFLAKTSKYKAECKTYPEQLCSIMGLHFDRIPLAELSLLAYGIEKQDYHWMHADPVHMMADVDHLILYDSNSLELTLDESNALLLALNNHFIQDDIEFVMGDANHWFVKSKQAFDVTTKCLDDVVMQNINQLMPVGEREGFFKQLLNESQMLLHSNAINEKREVDGLLTANSLWLWGEGTLSSQDGSDVVRCFGNDVLLGGVSNLVGVVSENLSTAESLVSGISDNGKNVVVFDDLVTACNYGDTASWLISFESLYETFLKPFIDYAVKNNLEINCYPCNGYRYVINSKVKYRFWRRGSMENYFESND